MVMYQVTQALHSRRDGDVSGDTGNQDAMVMYQVTQALHSTHTRNICMHNVLFYALALC